MAAATTPASANSTRRCATRHTFFPSTARSHFDFVAVPAISPLAPYLGVKGPLPARRVMEINAMYLVAFFDKHLRGEAVSLLDGPSPAYPEVQFEKR